MCDRYVSNSPARENDIMQPWTRTLLVALTMVLMVVALDGPGSVAVILASIAKLLFFVMLALIVIVGLRGHRNFLS
jgi:hypothetical protein